MNAYLVECEPWGGNSGAPCYWLHPLIEFVEVPDPRPGRVWQLLMAPHESQVTALLGLVSGHLVMEQAAKTEGDILGKVRVELNSGIAAVTPANAIRELLERDDVTDDRARRVKEGVGVTALAVVTPNSASLNTPVPEIQDASSSGAAVVLRGARETGAPGGSAALRRAGELAADAFLIFAAESRKRASGGTHTVDIVLAVPRAALNA